MLRAILCVVVTIISQTSSCESGQQNMAAHTENTKVTQIEQANAEECSIDFRNFTYPSPLDSEYSSFTLNDGKADPQIGKNGKREDSWYQFGSVYYVDLLGSEKKEAIVSIGIGTGGSASFIAVYVFSTDGEKPKLLWKFVSGDRASGGLRNVYALDRQLVLETYEKAEGKPAPDCCPDVYSRTFYRWDNGTFVETKKDTGIPNPDSSAKFIGESNDCAN